MLNEWRACLINEYFVRQITEYVRLVRKMSVNGVNSNTSAEQCKRQHEEEAEEQCKKLCTQEESVIVQKKSCKRHKYAMLLGYNGTNYHGMQHNGIFRTVESELFKAFAKVGIMDENEVTEPYAIKFQRAARTDRYVSAAGQVVSFVMTDNLCKPEDINAHLPPDIRIFSFKRVTKGFDSKGKCGARTYSYILPTHVLSQEPLEKFLETDYRITPEIIEKTNKILNMFVGTHNFHNFTSKRHFNDPRAKRFIMNFTCGEPFVKGKEFITLTVKGQSFILHQIRKMIGATIGIMRGIGTPDVIHSSFLSEKIRIPLAPGDGLYLERPHFDIYNKRYGNDGFHEMLTWEDVEEEVAKFRQENIINSIIDGELQNQVMVNWVISIISSSAKYFEPTTDDGNQKSAENAEDEEEDDEESEVKQINVGP